MTFSSPVAAAGAVTIVSNGPLLQEKYKLAQRDVVKHCLQKYFTKEDQVVFGVTKDGIELRSENSNHKATILLGNLPKTGTTAYRVKKLVKAHGPFSFYLEELAKIEEEPQTANANAGKPFLDLLKTSQESFAAIVSSFLDPRSLSAARTACKTTNETFNQMNELQGVYGELASLETLGMLDSQEIQSYIGKLNALQGNDNITISDVLRHCVNIDWLSIEGPDITDKVLADLADHCPKLEAISLNQCPISNEGLRLLSNYPNVLIDNCPDITNESLINLKPCPAISIKNCPDVTNEGLMNLSHCSSVYVTNCPITNEGLGHLRETPQIMIRNCPLITSLEHLGQGQREYVSIVNCPITNESLVNLSKCEKVRIENCPNIANEGLINLSYCQVVVIEDCPNITSIGLANLSQTPRITIRNCPEITSLEYLGQGQREYVSIANCPITNESLANLIQCKKVTLYKCPNITLAGIDFLRQQGVTVNYTPQTT